MPEYLLCQKRSCRVIDAARAPKHALLDPQLGSGVLRVDSRTKIPKFRSVGRSVVFRAKDSVSPDNNPESGSGQQQDQEQGVIKDSAPLLA